MSTGPRAVKALSRAQVRKARISGAVMFALAALIVLVLAPAADGSASFGLSMPDDAVQLPALSVPSSGSLYFLAAVLAFLGGAQFFRGFQGKTTVALGAAFGLFTIALMVWAAAGEQFSLVSMLVATVSAATPIALGALSGIMCERSGVVNIGIEGMLLGGAFTGVLIGSMLGGWAGLVAATLTGGLLALLLAVLAVNFRVDQIIIGVVINILMLGLTSFLTAQVLVKRPELNDAPIFESVKIPLLGDIPVLGPMLFDQPIIVYGMYMAVIYGGMIGGFAGAWFTLGTVGRFDEGMTGGRGFIGLAAMIFGAWNPIGAFFAALVFGFFDSLTQKFALLQTPIPGEFLAMAPYLVTIIVVAGLVGRARPPAADGQPFEKE